MSENPVAVAWMLTSPSVSGGKVYQIMLVENFLITGWGSMQGPTKQYKVEQHNTPGIAKQVALTKTSDKEAKGYALSVPPRTLHVGSGKMDTLQGLRDHRGANPWLQNSLSKVLTSGSPLSA